MPEVNLHLPSLQQIDREMAKIINQRVIDHLDKILTQIAKDHCLSHQQLKEQYLIPISQVAEELKKA